MRPWTTAELEKIEKADELDLSSLRQDGAYRNPVTRSQRSLVLRDANAP
jgi:hypothetical protein